jgi:hypothetical protein
MRAAVKDLKLLSEGTFSSRGRREMRDLEIDVCAYNTRFSLGAIFEFSIGHQGNPFVSFTFLPLIFSVVRLLLHLSQHSLHHGVVFFFVVVVHTTQSE